MIRRNCLVVLALSALVCAAGAQDEKKPDSKSNEKGPAFVAKEHVVTTTHTLVAPHTGGGDIQYTANAGYLELPNYDGKTIGNIFYVAYTKNDAGNPADRPITFAFNGGPGSSSVWLHMGALGPKRVDMGEEGFKPDPPYDLIDNPYCWLPFTDLVFIDPVTTGYSRPAEGERAGQFHGLDEDIRAVAEFIRLYVTRQQRWLSPKFLAGESYGTTRAAGLSGYLQNTYGMDLSGLVLVSPVLNFQTIRFAVGNEDPNWLYVPTYTATAWYHKKLAPELMRDRDATLREAETWARTKYLVALAQGDAMPERERDEIAASLARYTGLSKEYVLASNLRINIQNFCKELLRDQHRTVGRLDSRFEGLDRNSVGSSPDHDPSMTAITGPYTACLYSYLRGDLKYENDLVYEILTGRVNPWSYARNENSYANVAETMREAISKNPGLKVLYTSGYYDLATPYFAMDYTANHLGLDPGLRGNIVAEYYDAGHMMYIRVKDLVKFTDDVEKFYEFARKK